MSNAEQKTPWSPTSPAEAREKLGALIPEPEHAPEDGYGHALTILADLKKGLDGKVDPKVINLMVKRVRDDMKTGSLPDNALDLVGYEGELGDWRE